MLKFNTWRAQRYLRSRFIEGTFLLASEATDIELELIDFTRALIKHQIGDVAIGDAWKVERIDQLSFRIKPGEAWFDGLPYFMRSSTDHLVSGNNLALGIVPVNTTIVDDPSGAGKIITMDGTTPDNIFRVVIQAQEQVITSVDDEFIKNANLSESTAQKMRLTHVIHIVPETDQVSSPVPYTGNNSTDKNLVNEILVQVGLNANDPGALISINQITGQEQIDGRDLNLIMVNEDGSNPLPRVLSDQATFQGGKLIDSNGNEFYINRIFNDPNDTVNQTIIQVDKEVDQVNPTIAFDSSYRLVRRDVFATDDVNGTPSGVRYYPVARFNWKQNNSNLGGLVHESVITDLRQQIEKAGDSQDTSHTKDDLRLAGGGTVTAEPTVKASGSFTISDWTLLAGDTFEVRGVNFVEGVDFNALVDEDTSAQNLAQAINDSSDPLVDGVVEATAVGAVVNIQATSGGSAANSYTISFSDDPNGATASGATLTGGVDATDGQLLWSEDFEVINPHGASKFIVAASDAVLRDGGSLAYFLDYDIGSDTNVELGELALTSTSTGTSISFSGAPDLSQVKIGNTLLIESTKESAGIIDVDDINKTVTVDTSLSTAGSAVIYLDTFAPGTLPLGPNTFVLAVKTGDIIQVTNGVGLESGESTSGAGGVPQQLLDYIGSSGETDDSPNYSSTAYVGQGDDLTTSVSKLDKAIDDLDKFNIVDYVDIITTALPATPAVTIDGNALIDGDRVLFTDSGIEGVYEVSNIGVSANWKLLKAVSDGDFVSVVGGTEEFRTIWERSNSKWRLVNTSQLEGEPTGFPNRTDTTISFDDGTRTFTISPTGSSFDIFIKGQPTRFTTPQTYVIPDLEGEHFIYFDGATKSLTSVQAFTPALLSEHAYAAAMYWDATNNERVYFADERHGLVMDHDTHIHFHNSFGAQYTSGLALENFSIDGDGTLDAHSQFTSASGSIRDEDLLHILASQTQIPVLYRDGVNGDWRKKAADAFPVIYSGTAGYTGANGRLPYNQFTGATWQLTEVAELDFVLVHIFGTNDQDAGVVAIQGQQTYTTAALARAGAVEEIESLAGLPFQEFVPLGSVIFQTSTIASNTTAARVLSTADGAEYVDFRGKIGFGAGSGPGDHGALSGLNDPDHGPTAVTTAGVAKTGAFSASDTDLEQALDTLDKTLGTLRLKPNASNTAQVDITDALKTLNNSDQIDQVIGDFLMDFSGETIDFTTGTTVGTTNIVGLSDIATEIPVDLEYKWFAVGLLPDTINVTAPINRMVPQIQVNPATSANAVLADAPLPFMVGDVKLGAVLIRRNGAVAEVVEVNKLGVGSGGGSSSISAEVTLNNNQSTPSDITNFIVDSSEDKAFAAEMTINRFHRTAVSKGTTFNNNASGSGGFNNSAIVSTVQSDGKILVGGIFTTYEGNTRNRLVRLNSNGTEDTAFYTNHGGFNGEVRDVVEQPDGKILVAGSFNNFGTNLVNSLVRLNSDGTEDTAFTSTFFASLNGSVRSVVVQSDGKILVGGVFTSFKNKLLRLNSDGSLDTTFNTNIGTGFNNFVTDVAVQSDGKILVGGTFTSFNGNTRNSMVRLNADGTEDTSFYATLGTGFGGGAVYLMRIQSDGKILVGGSFTTVDGVGRGSFTRLNSDGSEDSDFGNNLGSGFTADVINIEIDSNGKILVGGTFTSFNGNTRNYIVSLNDNGTENVNYYNDLGTAFQSWVYDIALQSNNNLLFIGQFSTFDGVSHPGIVSLNEAQTTNLKKQFTLRGFYDESNLEWNIGESDFIGDSDTGVTLFINSSGQLQYTSTHIGQTLQNFYLRYTLGKL